VAQHGDPRDPKVDAVDWVERIPLAETRNYVQRVMENLQVYRVRFGAGIAAVEPNLHRAATVELRAEPVSVEPSVPPRPGALPAERIDPASLVSRPRDIDSPNR
jgi:hypothetical protein